MITSNKKYILLIVVTIFLLFNVILSRDAGHDHEHNHEHEHSHNKKQVDEDNSDDDTFDDDDSHHTLEEDLENIDFPDENDLDDETDEDNDETDENKDDDTPSDSYTTDNDGVIVMTAKNFDYVVSQFPLLLVEFYATWCGHCKQLAPEYAKAAKELAKNDPPLYLAKIDANDKKNLNMSSKYHIEGFPTLKLFRNNTDPSSVVNYEDKRVAEDIIRYMKKKLEPLYIIKTKSELDELRYAYDVVIILYLKDITETKDVESPYSIIKYIAERNDYVSVALTSDLDVFDSTDKKLIKSNNKDLILYKNFDEGKNVFNELNIDLTIENVNKFIDENKMPLIVTYSQEKASQLFNGKYTTHMLIFADESKEYSKDLFYMLKSISKKYRSDILHISIPLTEVNILKHFKLDENEGHLPALILVHMENGMKKYVYPVQGEDLIKEIKDKKFEKNLDTFEDKYINAKLKPTLNSAEPEDDNKENVKVIVGKEFDKRIMENKKQDILLEFYAPWCGHCKALAPKYKELADNFKDISSIMIAKIDGTENEIDHPKVQVSGFPTIYFFPANDKENPIKFDERERDIKTLTEFIKKHAYIKFSYEGETYGKIGHDEL